MSVVFAMIQNWDCGYIYNAFLNAWTMHCICDCGDVVMLFISPLSQSSSHLKGDCVDFCTAFHSPQGIDNSLCMDDKVFTSVSFMENSSPDLGIVL